MAARRESPTEISRPAVLERVLTVRPLTAVWVLWGTLTTAVLVTYTRLHPEELYHVTNEGIAGGLSRSLVLLNYPIALVAIATILVATDVLGSRSWRVAGPAIGFCALTAWPGVVDENDLDATPINIIPAIGVVLALVMTGAALRAQGTRRSRVAPIDTWRLLIAGVLLIVSIPWIAADLGFFLPEGVFISERAIVGDDGASAAAVHLGHHHGLDGALLAITALLLSRHRFRDGRLRRFAIAYLALMFGYGLVNSVQDLVNEQLYKRDVIDWSIPSALQPSFSGVWLAVLVIAGLTAVVLSRESATVNR